MKNERKNEEKNEKMRKKRKNERKSPSLLSAFAEVTVMNVKQGQVSRARQEFVGSSLAPKNQETLAELLNRRPQIQVREIPVEVLVNNPKPVNLDVATFTKCLASAPSGSAPGPGRCTYEMLKLCLDDAKTSR